MHYNNQLHPENNPEFKGLTVNQGVEYAPVVNPYRLKNAKRKKILA